MKTLTTKKVLFTLAFSVLSASRIFAQKLGLETAAGSFLDEVRTVAPIIIAGIFIVAVLFNVGKILGENRDYKSFFTGVALFAGSMYLVIGIFTFILTLKF